jgi:hypothetical protein
MQRETYHGRKRCTQVKCDLLCRNAIQFVSYENFLTFLSPGMHGSSPNVNLSNVDHVPLIPFPGSFPNLVREHHRQLRNAFKNIVTRSYQCLKGKG